MLIGLHCINNSSIYLFCFFLPNPKNPIFLITVLTVVLTVKKCFILDEEPNVTLIYVTKNVSQRDTEVYFAEADRSLLLLFGI